MIFIEHWVQNKELWDAMLEGIVIDGLGDGVWPISERAEFAVGSKEVLLL